MRWLAICLLVMACDDSAAPAMDAGAALDRAVDGAPQTDAAPTDAGPIDAESRDLAVDSADEPDAASDALLYAAVDAGPRDAAVAPDALPDATPDATPPDGPLAIVIAGDSWSTGSVGATRRAFEAREIPAEIRFEGTAIAGSQAREWIANHEGKLDTLFAALDADPPARVLLLYLGGNDFNFDMEQQGWSQRRRDAAIDGIEMRLGALVDTVRRGRPHLQVVLVGYTFFNYLKMRVFYGFDIAPNLLDYNAAFVEIEARKRAVAEARPQVFHAHNLGLLQHRLGDVERLYPFEPFRVPPYEPGFFPAPGGAPAYDPFPGGNVAFPAPDPAHFDGLHPEEASWDIIIDALFAQGLAGLVDGRGWRP